MIKEIKLSSLNNVIPKVNKKEPPRSVNNDLTPFFFTSMFIGSKNSGKSYGLVKMIKNYEEQPVKDSKGNIRTTSDPSLFVTQISSEVVWQKRNILIVWTNNVRHGTWSAGWWMGRPRLRVGEVIT